MKEDTKKTNPDGRDSSRRKIYGRKHPEGRIEIENIYKGNQTIADLSYG